MISLLNTVVILGSFYYLKNLLTFPNMVHKGPSELCLKLQMCYHQINTDHISLECRKEISSSASDGHVKHVKEIPLLFAAVEI